MNRARVEELKRAERAAIERVHALAKAEPYDAARYHRALVEWKSARLALRSLGVAVPKDSAGIEPSPTGDRPDSRKPSDV